MLRALQLAQAVVDAGAVAYLAPLIQHDDGKLKRQVCSCLAQIAKHSVDLAEVVVEAEIFPKILTCLGDVDTYVRKNAATCVREVAKHTPEVRGGLWLWLWVWLKLWWCCCVLFVRACVRATGWIQLAALHVDACVLSRLAVLCRSLSCRAAGEADCEQWWRGGAGGLRA